MAVGASSEIDVDASTAAIRAVLFDDRDVELLDDGEWQARARRIRRSQLLWIDVGAPTAEIAGRLATALSLGPEIERRLGRTGDAPSFASGAGCVHVAVGVPVRSVGDGRAVGALEELELLVSRSWVVTVHGGAVPVLDDVLERASGGGATGRLDGPSFVATVLEWVLNEYLGAFEDIETELEEIEVRGIRAGRVDPDEIVGEIVELRRRAGRLRRTLTAHREPLLALARPEFEAIVGDAAPRFDVVVQRFDETVAAARDVRDSIAASFDVVVAHVGHRTNEIVKVLTLVSVMLLPGSLVAALMGMNFRVGLFDHPALFWVVVAGILVAAVTTAAVARRRRWV